MAVKGKREGEGMGRCRERGSGCHWHPASVGRGADHGQGKSALGMDRGQ